MKHGVSDKFFTVPVLEIGSCLVITDDHKVYRATSF